MTKYILIFTLLIINLNNSFAVDNSKRRFNYALRTSLMYGSSFGGELSFYKMNWIPEKKPRFEILPDGNYGFSGGINLFNTKSQLLFSPTLGYHFYYKYYCIGTNMYFASDFNNLGIYQSIELGLTFHGGIFLNYMFVAGSGKYFNPFSEMEGHYVKFGVNLPQYWLENKKTKKPKK